MYVCVYVSTMIDAGWRYVDVTFYVCMYVCNVYLRFYHDEQSNDSSLRVCMYVCMYVYT